MPLLLREWPQDSAERKKYGDEIFGTIARRYDLLTRLLSFGQDRRWKAKILRFIPAGGERARRLDLATGTAALPILFRAASFRGSVVGLDRSAAMLGQARRKCAGLSCVDFVQGDLNDVPFPQRSFDAVTMAYGLRYLADIRQSLAEIFRLLKPGGVLVSLDFGLPERTWYRRLSLGYLLVLGTFWGLLLHRRADIYWHIVESLRAYPGQRAVAGAMREVGFSDVALHEQLGGISVIARGTKPA